jgi:lipopolysaccharide export LptBFGC system permease protein LptF
MRVLTWVFVVFGLLELMNVAVLYGAPGSRRANGIGVFTAWERSKADPEVHLLVRYLVYWVAGVKVIFLALLAVIVVTGTQRTKTAAGAALAASVAVFFWRMFPLARRADRAGAMLPAGYSRTLGIMIAVMVAVLALSTIAAV